ncbi:MAG: MmcQ/YjbR family DNA-binding protein [Oscillospiraceae bacterium]|nr:MmcQ/YjbR family DNA-binding protein [Oscillospiraceae bacterium]
MAGNQKSATRQTILQAIAEQYGIRPAALFQNAPEIAVFRRESGKWFGIIIPVHRSKLGLPEDAVSDVLNVKCDPMMLGSMLLQKGFFPAYHMNKQHWVSILLDGSVPAERVMEAVQMSYALTAGGSGKHPRTQPKAWLVPANPKYENLSESLAVTHEIYWKQSGKFIVGDTLYIYEGKPIGAVTYACEVTAVNIPYHFNQGGLHMDTVVQLRLLAVYEQTQFPLVRLQDYGVLSVRGPRGIPDDLLAALRESGRPVQNP